MLSVGGSVGSGWRVTGSTVHFGLSVVRCVGSTALSAYPFPQ